MYTFSGILSIIHQTLDRLRSVYVFMYAVPVQTSACSLLGMDNRSIQFFIYLNLPNALTFGIRGCFDGSVDTPGYNI